MSEGWSPGKMAATTAGYTSLPSAPFTKYNNDVWSYAPASRSLPIRYRDKEYTSATDALEAYIQDYDGMDTKSFSKRSRLDNDVDKLLMSQADLNLYGKDDSFGGRVREKAEASRLASIQDLVDKAYVQLQQAKGTLGACQVTEALNSSQRLLNRLALDDTSSLPGTFVSSHQPSMTTDDLLSAPSTPKKSPSSKRQETRRAYRNEEDMLNSGFSENMSTPKNRPTISRVRETKRPVVGESPKQVTFKAYINLPVSQLKEFPTFQKERFRSYTTDDIEVKKGPPSWVQELARSDISSTVDDTKLMGILKNSGRTTNKGADFSFTDLNTTPIAGYGHIQINPLTSRSDTSLATLYYDDSQKMVSDFEKKRLEREISNLDINTKVLTAPRREDLLSLTTDDLCYASPDGKSLGSRLDQSDTLTETPKGRKRAGKGSSLTSDTDRLLLQSSSGRKTKIPPFTPLSHNPVISDDKSRADKDSAHVHQSSAYYDGHQPHPELSNEKHRNYIRQLMKEIEDSSSSVVSPSVAEQFKATLSPLLEEEKRKVRFQSPDTEELLYESSVLPPSYQDVAATTRARRDDPLVAAPYTPEEGGFLDRIRKLLTSPPPDASLLTDSTHSPGTDAILDGDRSWEKGLPMLKPPRFVIDSKSPATAKQSHKQAGPSGSGRLVDRFMDDCLGSKTTQEPGTLTGGDQPGSMEALKNILFTVQTMVPPSSTGNGTSEADSGNQRIYRDISESKVRSDGGVNGAGAQVPDEARGATGGAGVAYNHPTPSSGLASKLKLQVTGLTDVVDAKEKEAKKSEERAKVPADLQHLLSTSFENQPDSEPLEKAIQHLTVLKALVNPKDQ